MRKILLILIFTTFSFPLIAVTPLGFLHLPNDATTLAEANISTIQRDNPSSIQFNPAGLAGIKNITILLSHSELYSTLKKEYIAVSYPLSHLTFGISLNTLYDNGIPYIVDGDTTENSLNFKDFQASVGVAANIIEKNSWGTSIGLSGYYVAEPFLSKDKGSFALNGGLQLLFKTKYATKRKLTAPNLILGVAIRNIGQKIALGSEKYHLPLSAGFGVSYAPFKSIKINVEENIYQNRKNELSLAIEGFSKRAVNPHFGVIFKRDENPIFTTGVGAQFRLGIFNLSLNWAGDFFSAIENKQYFSISIFKFKNIYERAKKDQPPLKPLGPLGIEPKLKEKISANIKKKQSEIPKNILKIAILPFYDLSQKNDLDWLSKSINDTVFDELQSISNIYLIEDKQINDILNKLNITTKNYLNKEAIIEFSKLLNSDFIIYGTYEQIDNNILINYNILDGELGVILKRKQSSTKIVKNLFNFLDKLSKQVFIDIKGILEHN